MSVSLDVGCGQRRAPGHLGVDCRPGPGVDVVADASHLPFEDGSVDAITCSQMVEHVFPVQSAPMFAEWARVMRRGATLRIDCPDFAAVAQRFSVGVCDLHWARALICGTVAGLNSVDYDDPASYHRTLWDAPSLAAELVAAGFAETSHWTDDVNGWAGFPWRLNMEATRI